MTAGTEIDVRSYQGAERCHRHDHHQVILPLEGRLYLETEQGTDSVDGRQGAIVAAGGYHAFAGRGNNRFLILDATVEGDPALWDAARRDSFFALGTGLRGLLQYADSVGAQGLRDPAHARRLADLLLHGLAAQVLGREDAEPAQLRRALSLIHSDYGRPLSVAAISRHAGVSASTLTRLFRAYVGRAPADYIADVRLSRAEDLLAGSRLSIAEIALRCGYGDQAALTRAFRRRRDVTPAALRRRLRR